jgi:hypothetical protein
MKAYLEYIAEIAPETDPVNIILSVAELVRSQAEHSGKIAKLNMVSFLTMLRNAGLNIDFEGLTAYYEAEPNLKNKIQQFNDREIVFVAQGDEVDSETLGQPQGDIPPEEKVEKMAKRAMKARESVHEDLNEVEDPGNIGADGGSEYKVVEYTRGGSGQTYVTFRAMNMSHAETLYQQHYAKPNTALTNSGGMVIKVTEENTMSEEYNSELTSMLDLAGVDNNKITEKNPDETISPDEGEDADELYSYFSAGLDDLISNASQEADRIGGKFRSPGIIRELRNIAQTAIEAQFGTPETPNPWKHHPEGDVTRFD